MSEKILVVEDDANLMEILELNLRQLGYDTEFAEDGETGLEKAVSNDYALVILDLMLPKIDGMEVCRRLREKKRFIPVLMLTARDAEIDRVLGLELGADDYVAKPFSVRELCARVRALLRRANAPKAESDIDEEKTYVFEDLTIDVLRRRVTRNGSLIRLTPIEFDILIYLAQRQGRPVLRENLIEHVWGYSGGQHDATVNSQMSKIRKKIEVDPENPKYILTIWGIGYQFMESDNGAVHEGATLEA